MATRKGWFFAQRSGCYFVPQAGDPDGPVVVADVGVELGASDGAWDSTELLTYSW